MSDTAAFYRALGQRIRTARLATGHSQTDLAECVGFGSAHAPISMIEAGKQRPEIHVLIAIADALGTTIYALLEEA